MDRNAEKHLDEPQTSKTAFDWDWFEALMKEDEPEDSPIGTEQSLRTEDEPEAPPVEAGQSIRTPEKKTVRERRTRRRLSVFSKFLMIYSGVFLLLIAVGLVFFWKYIAAYEASRPERTMDVLTATVGGNAAALNEYFQVTAFENKDSVFDNIYSKAVEGQRCSYRKMIGIYTDDAPAYVFRAGSTDLFQIVLRPKGIDAAGFGFQLWELDSVEMLPGNQRSVTIEAPPDASVTLNGLDVDASYITESHAAYDSADENRFNPDAYRVIYTVGGLCGDVSVAVTDRDGRELPAEKSDGTSFVFDAIRQSVGITAPADAKVSVNGVELGEKCIIGSLLPKGLFQGLEKYADAIPDFILYRVDNLLGTPSVTAEDASGRDLTAVTAADSTVFGLAWDEALKEAQTQLVTDFMKAYVPYTVNEGENTGANLQRLLKFLLPGTDTYERLKNASEGISWLTGGTAEYNELTPDRFLSCGENSFVCRVTLSITVTADGNVRNTDGAYWLVFVRSGGNWLLGSMAAEKSGTPA